MKPLGLPDPRRIGPYRIFAQLGRGGMGRVFLAGAPDGRLVALKLVHAQHVEEPGFRERFRREVAASRRVSGAYTAPVMDADVEAEIPWLVTAFVPGPSLRQAVDAAGALPADTTARLAAGLATALGEIHAAGLVHRDLKPSNVLLAADGPRVIDFGVARATDGATSELTHTGWLVGSPGYMSPEQAESKSLTPASDVFSLGSVVYMACTGTEPFMGASTPATLYNVVHAEPDLAAVPERLRGVIRACLAKDPAARPSPEQVLGLIGDVPAMTRTWPDAVHALIEEQDEAVVVALRDEPGPTSRSLPEPGPRSKSKSKSKSKPRSMSKPESITEHGTPPSESVTWASHPPESLTVVGAGRDRRRSRKALTAVLAVAALAVGGTAAALVTNSGGSPTAANAPVSSSAAEVVPPTPSTATSPDRSPSTDATDATVSASPPVPPSGDASPDASASGPSTVDPDSPTEAPSTVCIGSSEAYALAEKKNRGTLPSDARVSVLKCDGDWAAGRLTSATYGDATVVYEATDGAWDAVDLGSEICTGPIAKAPADVRTSANC